MLNRELKICKILTFSEEDLLAFGLEFSSSGVEVIPCDVKNSIKEDGIPTLIVGWSNVKILFPTQRISKRKISDSISWVYSISEDKSNTMSDTKTFVKSILSNWLPDTYVTYDCVLDGKLSKFLESNLTKPYNFYVYFSGKAMYIYNSADSKKIIAVNLESMRYFGMDVKKSVTAIIEKYSPICLSYSNVSPYLSEKHEPFFETIENLFWARYFEEISEKYFYDFIMDVEADRFIPFIMNQLYKNHIILEHESKYIKRLNKKDVITNWLSKRELFFDKNYENEKLNIKKSNVMQSVKLLYSNKKTITGRINCADRRFNPQMLAKDSIDRKMITSKFKAGKIVVFDYVSFETKLSMFLSQDKSFINKFKDKDLHEETAKIIFEKKDTTSEERGIGKSINHTLIYGGGKDILKKILKDVKDVESAILRVKKFLTPIINLSKEIQSLNDDLGYLLNAFGTIIKPQKSWASFSNFVSAMAADILVEKLFVIREFLINKKSKFLYQVHDSFVFDIHPDDTNIIEDIKKILSEFNNITLQVNTSEGNNLYECSISEEIMDIEV